MYREDITLLQRAAVYLGIHYGVLGAEATREARVFQSFSERGIHNGMSFGSGSASYDIRLDQNTELKPHEFKLASSREYFSMPDDVVGIVHDKSSHARRGVSVFNTVIDPGWRGYLTLEMVNHSEVTVRLSAGDPIAQVILHSLDEPTEKPYEGKYQDQPRGPQIPLKEDGTPL